MMAWYSMLWRGIMSLYHVVMVMSWHSGMSRHVSCRVMISWHDLTSCRDRISCDMRSCRDDMVSCRGMTQCHDIISCHGTIGLLWHVMIGYQVMTRWKRSSDAKLMWPTLNQTKRDAPGSHGLTFEFVALSQQTDGCSRAPLHFPLSSIHVWEKRKAKQAVTQITTTMVTERT